MRLTKPCLSLRYTVAGTLSNQERKTQGERAVVCNNNNNDFISIVLFHVKHAQLP